MTVLELKEALESYENAAKVIVVNWENGRTFEPSVGSDDEDEGEQYCRIGI